MKPKDVMETMSSMFADNPIYMKTAVDGRTYGENMVQLLAYVRHVMDMPIQTGHYARIAISAENQILLALFGWQDRNQLTQLISAINHLGTRYSLCIRNVPWIRRIVFVNARDLPSAWTVRLGRVTDFVNEEQWPAPLSRIPSAAD